VAKKFLLYVSQDYSFAVLRPIQKAILARGDQCAWFVEGDEVTTAFFASFERRLDDIKSVIDFNPDVVLVPGNVVPDFIPGLKVQVFHGLPSRKTKKNGQLYHYIIRGMFDLYCTQGPESTQKFNNLKRQYGYFEVAETGWSKLDPIFEAASAESEQKQKSIFFASTFSPRFSKAEILYPLITRMVKEHDFHWFITLHPKMNHETVERYHSLASDKVTLVQPTEFTEYFKRADMMLCDTSSIIYEFLTQIKPVVTFQTEKDEPCLVNVEQLNLLEKKILEVLQESHTNRKNILESVSRFHPYRDGKSSERVLSAIDKMLAGENLPAKKKPKNFLRNLKLRHKLGYWKI